MASDDSCFDPDPDLTKYYQGDILKNVPFPLWPTLESSGQEEKWAILRPLISAQRAIQVVMRQLPVRLLARAERDVTDAFCDEMTSEYIMARCEKRTVLVLTRSCALDNSRRKHLVVAPVTAFQSVPSLQNDNDKLTALRSGKIPQSFYLPQSGEMPESFADLLSLTSIHRSFLPDAKVAEKLIARMNSVGTLRLQNSLSVHFGTKFGFDDKDVCPQDGTYSYSYCFHSGIDTVRKAFAKGVPFGHCHGCGENACFVKIQES